MQDPFASLPASITKRTAGASTGRREPPPDPFASVPKKAPTDPFATLLPGVGKPAVGTAATTTGKEWN